MTFYSDMAATVQEILAEFGAPAQVTRTEQGGEYDPETGDYVTTTVTQDCISVVLPVDQKLVDGTTVLATDETAYLSAVGVTEPRASDRLKVNGKIYTVIRCKNLAPAGQAVLYELQVRA